MTHDEMIECMLLELKRNNNLTGPLREVLRYEESQIKKLNELIDSEYFDNFDRIDPNKGFNNLDSINTEDTISFDLPPRYIKNETNQE